MKFQQNLKRKILREISTRWSGRDKSTTMLSSLWLLKYEKFRSKSHSDTISSETNQIKMSKMLEVHQDKLSDLNLMSSSRAIQPASQQNNQLNVSRSQEVSSIIHLFFMSNLFFSYVDYRLKIAHWLLSLRLIPMSHWKRWWRSKGKVRRTTTIEGQKSWH